MTPWQAIQLRSGREKSGACLPCFAARVVASSASRSTWRAVTNVPAAALLSIPAAAIIISSISQMRFEERTYLSLQ